jgi:CHAT domain-containing protein
LIVAPVRQSIAAKKKLLIVPSGVLWSIPFEVLFTPLNKEDEKTLFVPSNAAVSFSELEYLVKNASIVYCQSASIFYHSRHLQSAGEQSLIAFADPSKSYASFPTSGDVQRDSVMYSLPSAREEARTIAQLFPPLARTVLVGDTASEANAKQLLQNAHAQVIHFATHGFLTSDSVKRVGLVLNASGDEDGILESSEIARLKIHADVVVLSACETGLGKQVAGEGTMGLARAFAIAGARSVIVSLWRVADKSTAELMKKFYEEFTRTGDASASLHRAQQWMFTESSFSAPYFWAPFIIVGR